jgi:hypothetical protein
MTRMRRIIMDKTEKVSVDPLYQRHPRSINHYINVNTVLKRNVQDRYGSAPKQAAD